MAQTGLEGLSQAIQAAFDRYYSRKRWHDERQELAAGREHEAGMLGTKIRAGAEEGRLGREFQAGESEKERKHRELLADERLEADLKMHAEGLKSAEEIAKEHNITLKQIQGLLHEFQRTQKHLDRKQVAQQMLPVYLLEAETEAARSLAAFEQGWEAVKADKTLNKWLKNEEQYEMLLNSGYDQYAPRIFRQVTDIVRGRHSEEYDDFPEINYTAAFDQVSNRWPPTKTDMSAGPQEDIADKIFEPPARAIGDVIETEFGEGKTPYTVPTPFGNIPLPGIKTLEGKLKDKMPDWMRRKKNR